MPIDDNNLFEWKGYLIGPEDTPYKDGIFYFKIKFPQTFPKKGPFIYFTTPIYHCNVNHKNSSPPFSLGYFTSSILRNWKPEYRIKEILIKFFYELFYLENPEVTYDVDKSLMKKKNPKLYEEKKKYFTKKYANAISALKSYKLGFFLQ